MFLNNIIERLTEIKFCPLKIFFIVEYGSECQNIKILKDPDQQLCFKISFFLIADLDRRRREEALKKSYIEKGIRAPLTKTFARPAVRNIENLSSKRGMPIVAESDPGFENGRINI